MKKTAIFTTLSLFIFLLIASCASTKSLANYQKENGYTTPVTVKQGVLAGVYNDDQKVEIFAGIPYAKPPVGNLRFKAPQDAEKWKGTFLADKFAPMSMQAGYSKLKSWFLNVFLIKNNHFDRNMTETCSEDCLYLNIWKPAGEHKNLPVMVTIHGGALIMGNSYSLLYDGENFARNGIIHVSIAYRTGIFGFLCLDELAKESPHKAAGNYGLLDQIKALEWVKQNIAAFGGDPDNITIAGESAGSSSVSALCTSPLAKGLFKNAIGTSSSLVTKYPPHTFYSPSQAREISKQAMEELEVSSVDELRQLSAKELLKVTNKFNGMTIDGYALTEYPLEVYKKGNNNETCLLNGYNKEEAKLFAKYVKINEKNYKEKLQSNFPGYWEPIYNLYPAKTNQEAIDNYLEIFTAVAFSYPHYTWTQAAINNGVKVYEYNFTKDNKALGSSHAGEIMYSYGNLPRESTGYDNSDYLLEGAMMSYWINFVKTGNPNGKYAASLKRDMDTLPHWPQASEIPDKIFELGEHIGPIEEHLKPLYPLIKAYVDSLGPEERANWDPRK